MGLVANLGLGLVSENIAAVLGPLGGISVAGLARPWRPGLGDNDPIGWTITLSYFAAAAMALRAHRFEREAARHGAPTLRPGFWKAVGFALIFLGFNKQLDLQVLLTNTGRKAFMVMGLYAVRRKFQVVFIGCILLVALGLVGFVFRYLGAARRRYALAVLGMIVLCAFIAIRAASFHHIDIVLGTRLSGTSLRVNATLELLGIYFMLFAAYRAQKTR